MGLGKNWGLGMRALAWSAVVSLAMAAGASVHAMESPLRAPGALKQAQRELGVQVSTARITIADYPLLRRDFPALRKRSEAQIDAWLLEQVAYVSVPQARQDWVNTWIERTGREREMIRPREYGRATVFEVPGGLIDVKGTGAVAPKLGAYGNGLATLGEVIREYAYQRLIEMVLRHARQKTQVVQMYAVIDWGFEVKQPDGSTSRAGAILRQAHVRFSGELSLLTGTRSLPLERIFRQYGITSTGADRDRDAEEINIQATREGALVDFGAYMVVQDFHRDVRNSFEEPLLLRPGQKSFPRPETRFRVPWEIWGCSEFGGDDPQADNPWAWSHQLADSLRNGTAGRQDVLNHLENLLGPVREILAREPNCAALLEGN